MLDEHEFRNCLNGKRVTSLEFVGIFIFPDKMRTMRSFRNICGFQKKPAWRIEDQTVLHRDFVSANVRVESLTGALLWGFLSTVIQLCPSDLLSLSL